MKIWILFLSLAAFAAAPGCSSPSSKTRADATAQTASVQQITRLVKFGEIRYALTTGDKLVVNDKLAPLLKNFDVNGVYYCRGHCAGGQMGLSSGVLTMSTRHATAGDNYLQFKVNGDATYVYVATPYNEDKTPLNPFPYDYRVEFIDANNAKILPIMRGEMSDPGYRMQFDETAGLWRRYTTTPGNQAYDLELVFDGDNHETKHTQQFFDDHRTANLNFFYMAVPVTSPLANGPLPSGPVRDADRVATPDADHYPDASSDAKAASGDSSGSKGGDRKGGR